MRPSLITSVQIASVADVAICTIQGPFLGSETAVSLADQSQETAQGFSRAVGVGYEVTVHSLRTANFAALDAKQVSDDSLLNITFNYADGSSFKLNEVGFVVSETAEVAVGSEDGWRLTGFAYGNVLADVATISPALPAAT